jgi:hypothetical protein
MNALTSFKGWKVHHLDMKTTFLNGQFQDEVYMEQSNGYETFGQEHLICKLSWALYGLKQAPCQWFQKIDKF